MILFTIIGSIIGAGFASGQEIYLFFYRFGINGILGILLCNIIMAIIIYKTLKIVKENKIYSYKDFLNTIFENKTMLINSTNIIINIFLCATFFIMISGFGSYLSQTFGINKILGSSILAIISYCIFLKNIEGITKINSIVIPALIFMVVIIGIKNILNLDISKIGTNITTNQKPFWVIQAILYASYNLILLIPVLINLKEFLKTKNQIKLITSGVGIIMCMMSIFVFLLLVNVDTDFSNLEMPIVYVIENKFSSFKFIYGMIILFAIFTTAISVGIAFLNNICKNKKRFPQFAGILCIISVLVSPNGFSNLVNWLFPFFGYLGIVEVCFILKL